MQSMPEEALLFTHMNTRELVDTARAIRDGLRDASGDELSALLNRANELRNELESHIRVHGPGLDSTVPARDALTYVSRAIAWLERLYYAKRNGKPQYDLGVEIQELKAKLGHERQLRKLELGTAAAWWAAGYLASGADDTLADELTDALLDQDRATVVDLFQRVNDETEAPLVEA